MVPNLSILSVSNITLEQIVILFQISTPPLIFKYALLLRSVELIGLPILINNSDHEFINSYVREKVYLLKSVLCADDFKFLLTQLIEDLQRELCWFHTFNYPIENFLLYELLSHPQKHSQSTGRFFNIHTFPDMPELHFALFKSSAEYRQIKFLISELKNMSDLSVLFNLSEKYTQWFMERL